MRRRCALQPCGEELGEGNSQGPRESSTGGGELPELCLGERRGSRVLSTLCTVGCLAGPPGGAGRGFLFCLRVWHTLKQK
jgi:hypothetical protein